MNLEDLQDEPPWIQSVLQGTVINVPSIWQLCEDKPEVTVTCTPNTGYVWVSR